MFVTKYENCKRSFCKLDLNKMYWRHHMLAPRDEEENVKWVISLTQENPNYDAVCWIVNDKDLRHINLFT